MAGWDDFPEAAKTADPWGEFAPAAPPPPDTSLSTKVRKFFDPTYPSPSADLGDVAKQAVKGASFLVPGGGVLKGALAGGLYGAGASEAKDVQGMAQDALIGAETGGALGGIGAAAAKYLPKAAHYFANKFLTNKTALAAAKEALPEAATEAAYQVGAIRPWRGIEGAANKLEEARNAVGKKIGEALRQMEASGVQGPDKVALAKELTTVGQKIRDNTLDPRDYEPYLKTAERILEKPSIPGTNVLPLSRAEDLKRSAQGMASEAYSAPSWAPKEGTAASYEGVASRLRSSVERAVEAQQSKAPELAASFVPLKQQFGPLQQAYEVAAEGAARAAGRGILGLPEWMALLGHGTPAALAVKAGRKVLPQSAGYAAWKLGAARPDLLGEGIALPSLAGDPTAQAALRTAIIEALRKKKEGE